MLRRKYEAIKRHGRYKISENNFFCYVTFFIKKERGKFAK